jgi:hypothetical protein
MSPAGSPLASSQPDEQSRDGAGSQMHLPMKDWRPARPPSAHQVSLVAKRLSARDLDVLRLIGRFRVMSGSQLCRLFWIEGKPATRARLARRALARLSDLEVLERLPRRVGGVRAGSSGLVFALGRTGQRLLQSERGSQRRVRRAYAPGSRYLAHALSVGDLYVTLIEAQRWGLVEVLAFDPEPACWRPYPGPYGVRLTAKPDAYARLGVGEFELSWLIEMDLATEARVTLETKARVYVDLYRAGVVQANDGVFPRVAWIAPDTARAEVIGEALSGLKSHHELFAVTTTSEAVALLTTEAGS